MSDCPDSWHQAKGEPYKCPSCGYWMGEGIVGDDVLKTSNHHDLRTRIAKVLHQRQATADAPEGWVWTWEQESDEEQRSWLEDADAVIRELPELKRIDHIRQICVASMNQDRDDPSSDRRWLADSILNILNGTTDE